MLGDAAETAQAICSLEIVFPDAIFFAFSSVSCSFSWSFSWRIFLLIQRARQHWNCPAAMLAASSRRERRGSLQTSRVQP
jgi:hypothetical protein